MKKKLSREQVISTCTEILNRSLLETNHYPKLLLGLNSIRRTLGGTLLFQVPLYDDYDTLFFEVLEDVRAFTLNLGTMTFDYSLQECESFERQVISGLKSFFRRRMINAFLHEFSVLASLLLVSLPGLIISIVNLIIK